MITEQEFIDRVKKVKEERTHKVTGSIGVYDAYKYIRKNKWQGLLRPVTEHEFYSIIRRVHKYLAEALSLGEDIMLPYKMGRLEVRKYPANIRLVEGKVVSNLPIDWDRTLKLWAEDEESYKKRTLIKMEEKELFKFHYNKQKAEYNNKAFYQFDINRDVKKKLKQYYKSGKVDAFLMSYGY